MKAQKQKWSFKSHTTPLGDTGDFDGYIQFTNGKDILQTCGDEIETEQLQQFCELLDLMPDLWSLRCDNAEFELSQFKKRAEHFEKALNAILASDYAGYETHIKHVDELKSIAFNALHKAEQGYL